MMSLEDEPIKITLKDFASGIDISRVWSKILQQPSWGLNLYLITQQRLLIWKTTRGMKKCRWNLYQRNIFCASIRF